MKGIRVISNLSQREPISYCDKLIDNPNSQNHCPISSTWLMAKCNRTKR